MDLDSLLAEVDAADAALAQSLAARWKAALALSAALEASDESDAFNPGRDAQRVRKAVEAATELGAPGDTVARVWRTLIGDSLTAARISEVQVSGGDLDELCQGARGYFGYSARINPAATPREALERVGEARGAVACLPWPEQPGQGQWWPMLNESRFSELRIVSGWPVLPSQSDATPNVAIVAKRKLESSGADDMFATAHDDHYEAERLLSEAGLGARVVARVRSLALIRIESFVGEMDARLAHAQSRGLDGLRLVGACPRP